MKLRRAFFFIPLLSWACGTSSADPEGTASGTDDDANETPSSTTDDTVQVTCRLNSDCVPSEFCSGIMYCDPEHEDANDIGCRLVPGSPCGDLDCNEETRSCQASCANADKDADGVESIECGGSDCDDNDAERFPGNEEVCDAENKDEDCDPSTVGGRDEDGDGVVDSACCNIQESGNLKCGDDCDDTQASINGFATEACDGFDNNCDGNVDEGVMVQYVEDADSDGYGSRELDAERQQACARDQPFGFVPLANATDCDDTRGDVNPGAYEICDANEVAVDEDCSGVANEFCNCLEGQTRECCESGVEECDEVTGKWGVCSIRATQETCNGEDDDCDGNPDDVFDCVQGSDPITCTTSCGTVGERTCGISCNLEKCSAAEECNGCDDDGDGNIDIDAEQGFICEKDKTGIPCVTACGTAGVATCNSTCDGYLTCVGTEACNYCDDNGIAGITEEKVMATSDASYDFLCGLGDPPPLSGSAKCVSTDPGGESFNYNELHLIDGSANSQSGTAWLKEDLFMGWEPLEFEIEFSIRPAADSTFPTQSSGPYGEFEIHFDSQTTGGNLRFRFSWAHWDGVYDQPEYDDAYRVYGRNGHPLGGSEFGSLLIPVSGKLPNVGAYAWTNVKIYIHYTPDDPSTTENEEVILIKNGKNGTTLTTLNKDTFWQPPNNALSVGTPFRVGVKASSSTRPAEAKVRMSRQQWPPLELKTITYWGMSHGGLCN